MSERFELLFLPRRSRRGTEVFVGSAERTNEEPKRAATVRERCMGHCGHWQSQVAYAHTDGTLYMGPRDGREIRSNATRKYILASTRRRRRFRITGYPLRYNHGVCFLHSTWPGPRNTELFIQLSDYRRNTSMKLESHAIGQALLDHHRYHCKLDDGAIPTRDSCLITYGTLCTNAGLPHVTRSSGTFLLEIAKWCAENDWPPLNALAVNGETQMPGDNYDLAPGCSLLNWPGEVDSCIRFRGYPDQMP